jgi:NADH-quinone oxidoreductase subunit N
MNPDYGELLRALLPEASLVGGALFVLTLDLVVMRGRTGGQRLLGAVSLGLIALVLAASSASTPKLAGSTFEGVLVLDALTRVTRLGVFTLTGLALLLLPGTLRLRHPVEFVAIILFAAAGFSVMAAAQQLMIAFVALELASLSLYVLAGFDRTRPESAEAGLKYFLFGGMAAAFLLFGFSLIYGLTGSVELPEIARQLQQGQGSPLLAVALVMVLLAFGFKAAAAPFHLWAPDVYQGAPASSAALIASASKLAGFTLFTRLLWSGLTADGRAPAWMTIVVVMSGASLVLGNVVALAQSNVRRLLAYSAIGHAGAMLLGVAGAGQFGPGAIAYYAFTYGLATVGTFGVVAVVERAGRCHDLVDLAGLHRRSPLLAGCLLIFVLSLAGIPPLAGFFGKFIVFSQALKLHGLGAPTGWLAILAIAMSAVALYYYLLILKLALVRPPAADAENAIPVPPAAGVAMTLSALLLITLGVLPSLFLRLFE